VKILYQHRTLADGAEGIHIREMIDAFRAEGHEVIVRAVAHSNARGTGHDGFWKRVKRMLPGGVFELAAAAYNLVDYVTFTLALRRCRPDFVYKRHAIHDFGVILAARHQGIPTVLEVNCPYSSPQHARFERVRFKSLARLCERWAVGLATVVAAVSSPLAGFLRGLVRHADHIMVLPNGANPALFRPRPDERDQVRQRLGWATDIVIGWAGILREWHGIDLLLGAVARVPGPRLLIIGDGPDRRRFESMVQRLGIVGRVTFTGRVSHEEVARYISAVDIAVASADRTGYASPMKLLEYMAMERATVAPRSPNIEDLIDDNVDGLLFEPDSEEALAGVLARLANDAPLRVRLGHQARLKVTRFRNWQRNAQIVAHSIADGPGPRGLASVQRLGSHR